VIGFIGLAVRDEHDDRIEERMLMAHLYTVERATPRSESSRAR
jgi:hypothetical protein